MAIDNKSSYLISVDESDFEKNKKEAKQLADKDGMDDTLSFVGILDSDELQFDDGEIVLSGTMPNLGYISVTMKLDLDVVTDIIEYYIKKVNRVKTVLQAVD